MSSLTTFPSNDNEFQQISALVDIHVWQKMNDDSRAVDQREFNTRLLYLEANQIQLRETLGMCPSSYKISPGVWNHLLICAQIRTKIT